MNSDFFCSKIFYNNLKNIIIYNNIKNGRASTRNYLRFR